MKSKKIIILALSLALLIGGAVTVLASANETEKSASVKITTLNYGADTRIAYALELAEGTSADDVNVKFYKNADLSDTPVLSEFSGEYYAEKYPVYYSAGISAKDIADAIYAVPCDAQSGEAVGAATRYSVAEYCYYNINNDVSADLKALSEDLLSYGKSAQQRLINIGNLDAETEILIGDYVYVSASADVITKDANGYVTRLFAPGEKVCFSYNGEGTVAEWNLTYADGSIKTVEATDGRGEGVNVTAIEAVIETKEKIGFEDGLIAGTYVEHYDLPKQTAAISNAANPIESYDGEYYDFAVVSDPENAANKVLKTTVTASSATKNGRSIVKSATDGAYTDYVFETKMYVEDPKSGYGNLIMMYFDGTNANGLFYFYFQTSESGVAVMEKAVSAEGTNSDNAVTTFNYNTWMNVRIEVHISNVHAENHVKFYIGEVGQSMQLVADYATCGINGTAVANVTDLYRVRLDYYRKCSGAIYYDDIYFGGKD